MFGTKVEVKNLNSFRSLERAMEFEVERMTESLAAGVPLTQETRGWDENGGRTVVQRSKEEANDYRYFPEPDLPPLRPSPEWVAELRSSLPELPAARRRGTRRSWDCRRTTRASSAPRSAWATTSTRWWRPGSRRRRPPTG